MQSPILSLLAGAVLAPLAWGHVVQDVPLHPAEGGGVTITEEADSLTVKAAGGPVRVSLATIDKPSLRTRIYGVTGEVRYSQVAGDGFLEMWSVFPSGRFFSRTLGEGGPTAKLTGDSEWRTFLLPFDRMGNQEAPGTLELNLVLPHGGEVSFRHLVLKEFSAAVSLNGLLDEEGAHWKEQRERWTHALAGVVAAILLALAGLCLLRRPRAARVCAILLVGCGLLLFAAGLAAIGFQQPPRIIYGLLGAGALMMFFFALVSSLLRKWAVRLHPPSETR